MIFGDIPLFFVLLSVFKTIYGLEKEIPMWGLRLRVWFVWGDRTVPPAYHRCKLRQLPHCSATGGGRCYWRRSPLIQQRGRSFVSSVRQYVDTCLGQADLSTLWRTNDVYGWAWILVMKERLKGKKAYYTRDIKMSRLPTWHSKILTKRYYTYY